MLDLLDQASAQAGARYSLFLSSLAGTLAQAGSFAPNDARAFGAIRVQATNLGQTFLTGEFGQYRQDLFAVQQAAAGQAQNDMTGQEGNGATWGQDGEAMADWYVHELGSQVWRDINATVHARRSSALRNGKMQFAPTYNFTDRAGRNYPAPVYVRQTARHGLVRFGAQVYTDNVVKMGASKLTVTHPESDHKFNGLELTPESLADHLTDVFHPNSRATLKAQPDVHPE